MAGKIFISYRRDDVRADAARIRDRLVSVYGASNVFMDVDNLLAGQRFDKELEKALEQCDAFLAVIGPHWLETLNERAKSGERDYVREEIASALRRNILVIPILIERTPLPRADALTDDIRPLVLHQKHQVTHERFGRDVADLVVAIKSGRARIRSESRDKGRTGWWLTVGACTIGLLGIATLAALQVSGKLSMARTGAVQTADEAKEKRKITGDDSQKIDAMLERSTLILIVDGSGSMWGTLEGGSRQSRIHLVREALRSTLGKVGPQAFVGLVAFGHRRGDCGDVEVMRTPDVVDLDRLMVPLSQMSPRGRGPLTLALREAAKAFPPDSRRRSLLLIHDDADNCQPDLCAAAAELGAANITVHVVGLNVRADDVAKMACLPQVTGGRYLNAVNAEQVSVALDEILSLVSSSNAVPKSATSDPAGGHGPGR